MELDELAERIERACADIDSEGRAVIIHVLQEKRTRNGPG